MSVFTTVSPAQLRAWLTGYAVGELVEMQGIAAGIENTNYFVTTTQARYVLTLFEKLTLSELPFYIDLMAHLAQKDIPCPAPARRADGQFLSYLNDKPACLASRLQGRSLEQPGEVECHAIGHMLARLHLAGADYPAHMNNPRGGAWRDLTAPQVRPFLGAADADLLATELLTQQALDGCDLPAGVIHADLFRDNVLFDGEKIGGLIDFYFACCDWWLFDLAITVNDWCLATGGGLDVSRARVLIQAYQSVRPLQSAEKAQWSFVLRRAALRFWLSRLFDLHFPRVGAVTHAKDPGHFARLLRWIIAQQNTLTALVDV